MDRAPLPNPFRLQALIMRGIRAANRLAKAAKAKEGKTDAEI